jgi:hypothetical protein
MIGISGLCGKPSEDLLNVQIDKEYSLRSVNLESDGLKLSSEYAVRKMHDYCRSLFEGDFSAAPQITSSKSSKPACEFCSYTAVCGIDPSRPPCRAASPIPELIGEEGKRVLTRDAYLAAMKSDLLQKGGDLA